MSLTRGQNKERFSSGKWSSRNIDYLMAQNRWNSFYQIGLTRWVPNQNNFPPFKTIKIHFSLTLNFFFSFDFCSLNEESIGNSDSLKQIKTNKLSDKFWWKKQSLFSFIQLKSNTMKMIHTKAWHRGGHSGVFFVPLFLFNLVQFCSLRQGFCLRSSSVLFSLVNLILENGGLFGLSLSGPSIIFIFL